MFTHAARYAKALVAILGAAATSLVVALDDGSMTVGDGVKIAAGAVISFAAVYAVPNKPQT